MGFVLILYHAFVQNCVILLWANSIDFSKWFHHSNVSRDCIAAIHFQQRFDFWA